MGRYERKLYFDRLCEMRGAYGTSPDDTRTTISIEDAIIYAEAVLTALEEHDRETALEQFAIDAEAAVATDVEAALPEPITTDAVEDQPTPPFGKFGPFGRFQGQPGKNRT